MTGVTAMTDQPGTVLAVTLVRVRVRAAGADSYVAVASAEADGILADLGGSFAEIAGDGITTAVLPWDTLPGAGLLAAVGLAGAPPRSVVFLGTAVDGRWISWRLPGPRPPVPGDQGDDDG